MLTLLGFASFANSLHVLKIVMPGLDPGIHSAN